MNRGDEIAAAARRWIGTPYAHQGAVRGVGADCLGLVRGVYAEVSGQPAEAPGAYRESWAEFGASERLLDAARRVLVPKAEPALAAGDVLVFRMKDGGICKHLGIVGRADPAPTFIHAYTRHGVLESSLSQPWRRRVAAVFTFPERID